MDIKLDFNQNSFNTDEQAIFYTKVNKRGEICIKAEKKSCWTWIKQGIFKDSYNVINILNLLEHVNIEQNKEKIIFLLKDVNVYKIALNQISDKSLSKISKDHLIRIGLITNTISSQSDQEFQSYQNPLLNQVSLYTAPQEITQPTVNDQELEDLHIHFVTTMSNFKSLIDHENKKLKNKTSKELNFLTSFCENFSIYSESLFKRKLRKSEFDNINNILLKINKLIESPNPLNYIQGVTLRHVKNVETFNKILEEFDKILNDEVWFISERGCSLLHQAAFNDSTAPAIPLLIAKGMNPNAQDFFAGNTPLLWAIANASTISAIALINSPGVDFNIQDSIFSEQTALHLAIAKGRRNDKWDQVVDLLIKNTDPNIKNKDGNTALHLAFARRDIAFINALLENGADTTIKNLQNQTPEDLWNISYEEAWTVINGSKEATTLDPKGFDEADFSKIRIPSRE